MRREGLEPSRLSAHAPQTCASASSATCAKNGDYFAGVAGAVGTGADAGGAPGTAGRSPCVTLRMPTRPESRVSISEVTANVVAKVAVSLRMNVDPDGEANIASPPPPNIESPAPRPACSRTTRIRNRQAAIWTAIRNVYMRGLLYQFAS